MIIRNKFNGYSGDGRRLYPGGGGGPTTSYTQTSNIPEYAQPYVERMLGATEKQVFQFGGEKGDTITGFQPFKSFSQAQREAGQPSETVAGFTPMQAQAMQGLQNYQLPGQTGAASAMTADLAGRALQAGQYTPSGFTAQNVTAPSLQNFQMQAAQTGFRPDLQTFQMGGPERVGTRSFLGAGTAEAYMSPYQQAVTDIEKREATRTSNIMKQQQQAQAVQQGAFGGSRQAIVEAERQRNLGQQLGDIQARGTQGAFSQAQQQFNAEQQARLQAQLANQQAGITTGAQNLAAQLGVQQLGTQTGLQTALANLSNQQQANVQNLASQLQTQGLSADQAMRAALANQQAGLETQRMGEQSRQFGAGLGMQGIEQARAAAAQLGSLGQQQYSQEMGLMGQQMDVGAKQQQYEQARLNQIIQDYATQQQYPFIQLGTLSNMLRGLPMQASTTQMYQAQPSFLQQGIGLAGAGANLYQAFKAEGGEIKEMAGGGIASGVDPNKLPSMMKKLSDDQLNNKLNSQDTDPETLGIAQAEQQRRDQVRGKANGGIVAFKEGGTDQVKTPFPKNPDEEEPEKRTSAVTTRPKAAAPKPAPVEKSPYQAEFKRALAEPSPIAADVAKLRTMQGEIEKEVQGGAEGQLQRKQEFYKKQGVDRAAIYNQERVDQNRALEEAQGDAKKAEYLRWAQLFAKFGSTPGPMLKAAVMSINDTIPDMLEDQKQARAIQRGIKKAIFELDKAEYLEKKGDVDAALQTEKEAKGRLAELTLATSKLASEEYRDRLKVRGQMASEELKGEFDVKEAHIRAAATGDGSPFKQTKEERLLEQAIDKAYKDETKTTQEKLARWKSAPEAVQQKNAATIASLEEQLRTKRAEIEARYRKQEAEKPKTLPPPTAEDIAHTAKRYGVSEEEVRKRLGI